MAVVAVAVFASACFLSLADAIRRPQWWAFLWRDGPLLKLQLAGLVILGAVLLGLRLGGASDNELGVVGVVAFVPLYVLHRLWCQARLRRRQ